MLYFDGIKVEFESQGFKETHIGISPNKDKSVRFPDSVRLTQTVRWLAMDKMVSGGERK